MESVIILIGIICFCCGFLLLFCLMDSEFSPEIPLSIILIGFITCIIGGCLGSANETVEIETNIGTGIIQIYDTQGNLIEEYKVQY